MFGSGIIILVFLMVSAFYARWQRKADST
jgi:hypothetical protein